jgi:hypothetical protein
MINPMQFKRMDKSWYLKSACDYVLVLNEINSFKKAVSAISINDFKINGPDENGNTHDFEVSFPDNILESLDTLIYKIDTLENMYSDDNYGNEAYAVLFGRDEDGQPMRMKKSEMAFSVQINCGQGLFNRIHFPGDGLPQGLQRLKIGSKIYELMAKKYNYVSSIKPDSSISARMLWIGLASISELFVFIGQNRVVAFDIENNASYIIATLEDIYKASDELLIDEKFLLTNKTLIEKSSLNKYL